MGYLMHTTYALPSLSMSSSFSTYLAAFFVLWGIFFALLAGPLLACSLLADLDLCVQSGGAVHTSLVGWSLCASSLN